MPALPRAAAAPPNAPASRMISDAPASSAMNRSASRPTAHTGASASRWTALRFSMRRGGRTGWSIGPRSPRRYRPPTNSCATRLTGCPAGPYPPARSARVGLRFAGDDAFTARDRTTSWEAGVDLGLLHDRMSFSATYYDERTFMRAFGASFGSFTETPLVTKDRGVELRLGASPIRRSGSFEWDAALRFGANRSRVDGRTTALGTLGVASLLSGQPFGTIVAEVPLRDSLGRALIDGGNPVVIPGPRGSELPSWVGGLENDVRYKHVSLMVLVDSRHGATVYSNTNRWGTILGTLASTVAVRQQPGGVILPGVNRDGTPNTTPINPEVYY